MHKDYIYIDGKVIISDENGNKTPAEYYDNLDEVLAQENLIEAMENKIQKLEAESTSYKKRNSERYIPIFFPATIITSITASLLVVFLCGGVDALTSSVDTIFGTMNPVMALSIPFCIAFSPLGIMVDFSMYRRHKNSRKAEKGINSELAFLKEQIKKEKEKLEKLRQEKTRCNENTKFRTVKVDDLQQLKMLRDYLEFYFDLGYNSEKYYKYYQQGKLDEKLEKFYDEKGVQLAKEYLEEQGPVLVKRKNNK